MRKFFVALLGVAILGVSANAALAAKGEKKSPEERFKKMDKDGNGSVSMSEMIGKKTGDKAAKGEAMFKRLDKDGDGVVTESEFKSKAKKNKKAKKSN